jgi:nitrite reductase/ring-hydroxylating ferredoxin subunit
LIGKRDDFELGGCKVVEVEGRSIAVWNHEGRLYALRNSCPHMGAPLNYSPLTGTMLPSGVKEYCYGMDGLVVRCAWHGYEFSVETGEPLFGTSTQRVVPYPVSVEGDEVYLELRAAAANAQPPVHAAP